MRMYDVIIRVYVVYIRTYSHTYAYISVANYEYVRLLVTYYHYAIILWNHMIQVSRLSNQYG